ncbi:ABC transporter permease [Pseudoclavibacter chungangensis]|uniref:ABC transporter permease n=1 Tax=Pseudoclavibacter chungangensis TaxID=587635 RepID=A0A7J5BUB3_9MICO|nr:ABC transporter permease [Pseudoclavibacter chungangensis]KAB1657946.1 ABC transporter permease [Pseudoclavibacter chungangensis]NYJ65901.1 ABC-type transport system involved in multi-copper enzyme maturation permease subunit [Pseudoclavibacter chungangensis]
MNGLRRIWTVTELELRQRVVSRTFYILLCIFFLTLLATVGLIVTITFTAASRSSDFRGDSGWTYGASVYLVLFLATIITPVLAGGTINADRSAGTLATVQVTAVRTPELLIGKFLAAWISSLAFAVVAIPFLVTGALIAGPGGGAAVVPTLLLLVFELGFLSALGVGFSGLVRSPLFSIMFTYLTASVLTVGTLVGFAAGATLFLQEKETEVRSYAVGAVQNGASVSTCESSIEIMTYPRTDLVYPLLALNPYVMIADVTPVSAHDDEAPSMLGGIKILVRQAQITPEMPDVIDYCTSDYGSDAPTTQEVLDRTVPTWFIGGALHTFLGAGLLALAGLRLRTPAGKLSAGTRVA